MNTRIYPALLATVALLAFAGCQRQTAEQPAPASEPRVAQTTPPAPVQAVPQTAREAAPPAASEPYVLEEQGKATAPVPPPPAAAQETSPPAATGRHDVEQPTRTVEPPANPPKPPKPQPTPKPESDRERRLAQRERRLAQRQAALDARERRLQQQESPDRTEVPMPDQPAPGAQGAPAPEPAPVPAPEPERPRPQPVTLETGTKVDIRFEREVSSDTSTVGEIFRARVANDVYAGDRLAIPAGSEIVGEVTQAVSAKKIGSGKSSLGLRVTDLVLPTGETVPIKASFQREGASRNGRDAATIGGATAGGAILGRILSKGGGKGTILGALIGAAAGAAIASKNPGEEVVIPQGSVLGIVLDRPLDIQNRP